MFISLSCKVSWLPALSVLEHLFSLLSSLLIEYGRFNYFFLRASCFILCPRFLRYFLRIQTGRIGMAPVAPPRRWDRALESEHMWARCSNQLATFMRMTQELRKVQDGTSQTRGKTSVSFREKIRSRMGSYRTKWATWLAKSWFDIQNSLTGTTIPRCSVGTLLFFAIF